MSNKIYDYTGIDIVKFVMSFAVIGIHAPEYLWPSDRTYPMMFEWLIRAAVPFFFITSGFLVNHKLNNFNPSEKSRYLIRRAFKIFRIWCCWLLLYLPLTIWGMSHETEMYDTKILYYFKDVFLSGHSLYSQALWFLYSMAFVFLIWGYIMRFKGNIGVILLFCIFAIISIIPHFIEEKNNVLKSLCIWILGGGLPIIGGAIFDLYIVKLNNLILNFVILTSGIISICLFYLGLPLYSFFGGLAFFILSINLKFKPNPIFLNIRKESMWIYFTHMYIVITFMVIINKYDLTYNKWLIYLCVCVICWIISKILNKFSNIKGLRKIDYLIK